MVDASGRAGVLKRQLGLAQPSPHKVSAAWFRVKAPIRIDDWSDDPAWLHGFENGAARWYSTNHLMGRGYWVWLIPLASGSTSVGIVADEEIHPLTTFNSLHKALAWLDRYEPQCAGKIHDHNGSIQDFRAIKQFGLECSQVFSHHRWGITGEAGFFLDPFYSPGSDFIALGNTMLSELTQRDWSGKSIRFRARLYDRIFKKFFYETSAVYQDKYPLFGNHQVMPVKILWDFILYWSLLGFLFLQDRACDQFMYPRHMFKLKKLGQLNHFMQRFFSQWHEQSPGSEVCGMINISEIPLIWYANERLLDDLNGRDFGRRFADNVAQLESLAWEIIDGANIDVDVPFRRRRRRPHTHQQAFKLVFEATKKRNASGPELSPLGAQ